MVEVENVTELRAFTVLHNLQLRKVLVSGTPDPARDSVAVLRIQFHIILGSWIWIRIKVKRWKHKRVIVEHWRVQIWRKVSDRIRIRIRVKGRILIRIQVMRIRNTVIC